jgi:hypothetical protein
MQISSLGCLSRRRSPTILFFYLLLWFTLTALVASQTCSKANPCSPGFCCSKSGYCGNGPDYCSKASCVDSCDAKSECRHGTWPSGYAKNDDCPLNVCCSKYGNCGTTTEFCGTNVVQTPQCDSKSTSPLSRVVGYYESWASRRACVRAPQKQQLRLRSNILSHPCGTLLFVYCMTAKGSRLIC